MTSWRVKILNVDSGSTYWWIQKNCHEINHDLGLVIIETAKGLGWMGEFLRSLKDLIRIWRYI